MHINLETSDKYTIQAYSESQIKINEICYQQNIIISKQGVITNWLINDISELENERLQILIDCKPEIIIIGHQKTGQFAPFATMELLSKNRIGFECMSIGAACRTYNVLLSEDRAVVLGILF